MQARASGDAKTPKNEASDENVEDEVTFFLFLADF